MTYKNTTELMTWSGLIKIISKHIAGKVLKNDDEIYILGWLPVPIL